MQEWLGRLVVEYFRCPRLLDLQEARFDLVRLIHIARNG